MSRVGSFNIDVFFRFEEVLERLDNGNRCAFEKTIKNDDIC